MTTPPTSSPCPTGPRPAEARTSGAALPEQGLPADRVLADLAELCADDHDYDDGTVFNSICSTPLPIAERVFAAHQHANLGDNRIFPSLARAEAEVTAMLAELMDGPGASGVATSGGTEANLLAVLAALRRHQRCFGTGGPARILLGDSAHFSFDKIAALLPVEVVRVPSDERLRVDTARLLPLITPDTALVVATAGSSESGAVDDVPAIAGHAAALGVPVHVDAATGGFLVPLARDLGEPLPAIGLSVPGVTSVTLDPHKYGGAPIPAGHVLFRDEEDPAALRTASHYRGTFDHHALLGTRPGGALLATWAALRAQGRGGYRVAVAGLWERRELLVRLLTEAGFEIAPRPELTVVTVRHPAPEKLVDELERQGLIASVARRLGLLRLVVHWHQDDRQLRRLVQALAEADGGRP
ncbi:aminotransferase class V-fold PLP-dependent enzyme [Kitasatospora brasiliensis]|uniref:aminotransferase class V-fold PLP-dependent enzyme n=1 Tax=Kitasatospora brasiliensis TaxID=3058040 RepID=UPI00292CBCBF|nr:aminotransferase class V-fold PLP-dependent enzyme [Kitasatospora sp. K002]